MRNKHTHTCKVCVKNVTPSAKGIIHFKKKFYLHAMKCYDIYIGGLDNEENKTKSAMEETNKHTIDKAFPE